EKENDSQAPKNGGGKPRLGLLQTTLAGKSKSQEAKPPSPAAQDVEEAVTKQQDLLAEFEKIADELNRVLANLEGSTLLKRLKAASRQQYVIGGRINDQLNDTFGLAPSIIDEAPAQVLDEMSKQEGKESQTVSAIMDDMHAFYRTPQIREIQIGSRRDASIRRDRQSASIGRRHPQGKRDLDRSVRLLVGYA